MDGEPAELMDFADDAMEYEETNSLRVDDMCREQGLVMSLPGPNELQVDLDTREDWFRFQRSWEILSRDLGLTLDDIKVTKSRSKEDGRHVRIQMPNGAPLEDLERIALQAALGSDPVREILSCIRVYAGDPHPTLFIEKPDWDTPPEPAEFIF